MNDAAVPMVAAFGPTPGLAPIDAVSLRSMPDTQAHFADWLQQGVQSLNQRLTSANAMAAQFALGADLPPHQVVLALEEARLSLQLAMQVRARLLEGYQDLMRMQL